MNNFCSNETRNKRRNTFINFKDKIQKIKEENYIENLKIFSATLFNHNEKIESNKELEEEFVKQIEEYNELYNQKANIQYFLELIEVDNIQKTLTDIEEEKNKTILNQYKIARFKILYHFLYFFNFENNYDKEIYK